MFEGLLVAAAKTAGAAHTTAAIQPRRMPQTKPVDQSLSTKFFESIRCVNATFSGFAFVASLSNVLLRSTTSICCLLWAGRLNWRDGGVCPVWLLFKCTPVTSAEITKASARTTHSFKGLKEARKRLIAETVRSWNIADFQGAVGVVSSLTRKLGHA